MSNFFDRLRIALKTTKNVNNTKRGPGRISDHRVMILLPTGKVSTRMVNPAGSKLAAMAREGILTVKSGRTV